ncbi:MAG TPA: TetR/AcrR family transcriptional regulator [Dermatophilaceae bacterium]|nr:TetR/AcrR family transcriptional regulator [Dermatophilaceae bacterium]
MARRTAGLGSAVRSTDRRGQTRDQVLDAALQLFNEHGYLGVRVEDIAKQAGVSRATFYKHFSEREQILSDLFERLLGAGGESAPYEETTSAGSVHQQVALVVEGAVRRMLEQEQLAKFVYGLPIRQSALLPPGEPNTPPAFTQVTRLLERAAKRGEVRVDLPVALLARHVLAALETGMRDWAEDRVDDPLDRVRLMLDLAFQGITRS